MATSSPNPAFSLFLGYNPFHNLIHYYVDLSVFLITSGNDTISPKVWWALNRRKRVMSLYFLEVQYGGPHVRDRFTDLGFKKAKETKKTVCAERLGFKDFFVPVLSKGKLLGFLQAGAFADKEMTLEDLVKCWKELSGRDYSPDLPEFRTFARAFLEIPVLDGPLAPAFQEALELFAGLLTGRGDEKAVQKRLFQLQDEVFSKRLPHSYWLDWALGRPTSESVPAWSKRMEQWGWTKSEIGLTRVPTTVLTVIPQRAGRPALDWAQETLRVYSFQRKSFLFAQTLPETVGGRLDDYGAAFVSSADPKLPRLAQKKWIEGIARKIRDFAVQELGGPVLVGVGETMAPGEPLNPSYRQAVLALHLWRGSEGDIVYFDGGRKGLSTQGFGELRLLLDELNGAFATASFSGLEELKDRFLRQAIQLSFQNPHEIRWHFQYALDRLSETVGIRMDMDARESRQLRESIAKTLEEAVTLQEIVLAYQDTLSKLEKEIEKPFSAQRDQSLEKVREYIDQHFKEPLRIIRLSKMAGVSVSTFSRRFKKHTGLGLEAYLQKRRLDEAKRLLKATRLPVFRIAKDCGFKSNPYFIHLFRIKNGLPPQEFRKHLQQG
jgi:AraC-like DNA-binding protein